MKKYTPYILGFLLFAAFVIMFITGGNKNINGRKLDERITYRKTDKIPYATYVAYNNLAHLFPKASISSSRLEPGYWDSVSMYDTKQAYIAVTDRFSATKDEIRKLISFARAGNDVFISARYISAATDNALGCSSSAFDLSFISVSDLKEDIAVSLNKPPFTDTVRYRYPGRTFGSYFSTVDTSTTEIMGYDEQGRPNFIHLRAGDGHFYVHLEPLAFSNYFLLHKNNIDYYEKALSVIDERVNRVVWDEYYLYKKGENQRKPRNEGWLSVLFRYPAFKAALLTAIFTLFFYVLMEMRRKQRYIPVFKKPKNDSLDFVKTIGRLYYDKGDHRNLCRKMASYFLEHVRSRYKLSTGRLDDEFVRNLHYKSGVDHNEISDIVSFVKYLDQAAGVNQQQLVHFHKQLELFYQKA